MKAVILTLVVIVTGCGSKTPDPVYVEVKVPIAVPCVTERVDAPAFAVDQLRIGAQIDEKMRALRAERKQRIGYERKLMAAIEACQQ